MSADVAIEVAAAGAAETLAALHARAFDDPWDAGFLASLMHLPGTVVRAALQDGRPVGFALARALGADAEVLTIAVIPEARGRGVGGALLAALIAGAQAAGATALHLEVSVNNAPAAALYRRAGFATTGTRPRYYADGSDALVMQRIFNIE